MWLSNSISFHILTKCAIVHTAQSIVRHSSTTSRCVFNLGIQKFLFYSLDLISLCLLIMSNRGADGKAILCEQKQININVNMRIIIIVSSRRPWGVAIVFRSYCDNSWGRTVRWTGGEKAVLHRYEKIKERKNGRENEYSQYEGQETRKEGRKVVQLERMAMWRTRFWKAMPEKWEKKADTRTGQRMRRK